MPRLECQWCGAAYDACADSVKLGSWRASACCSEHYQAKIIALDLHAGNITVDEARQMFDALGVDPATATAVIGLDRCVAPLLKQNNDKLTPQAVSRKEKKRRR